eukprot:7358810-Pyramimonas_sp.AAC.1
MWHKETRTVIARAYELLQCAFKSTIELPVTEGEPAPQRRAPVGSDRDGVSLPSLHCAGGSTVL